MTVTTDADILVAGVETRSWVMMLWGWRSYGSWNKAARFQERACTTQVLRPWTYWESLQELKAHHCRCARGVGPGETVKRRYGSHHSEMFIREVGDPRNRPRAHPHPGAGTVSGIDIIVIGAGIEPAAAPGTPLTQALCERIPKLIQIINEEIAAPMIRS